MNLIIISLALIGALVVEYSVVYTLVNVHTGPLWARILALPLLLGCYVGVVAITMHLLGIPIS